MDRDIKEEILTHSDENVSYIKEVLKGASDVVYRKFYVGSLSASLVYIDGMADKLLLDNFVLESLMLCGVDVHSPEEIKNRLLTVSDVREVEKMSEVITAFLSGDTAMFIDGLDLCYVIATRSWPTRGVSEPSGETVIRGAREGFTETIRFNTALVRRRVRDTKFKIEPKALGARSKSDTAIMYIEDIVNKDVLENVKNKIDKINIDAILDSGYIQQLIEDNKWSPFPQVQSTERPDVVAAALYEGRVAILVDNSPFAVIVPATLPNLFQSPDDYYQRWMAGSTIRLIRIAAIIISLLLPGLYVALTSFHTSIIPTKLVYSIAASREGVPFPAYVEAIVMEFSLALLMEAVTRLPKPIGSTIGIVGGLIIGQSAVSAGIVSPIMIIIVSVTSISSFITPTYEISNAFRIVRFMLIIAATIAGLYGMMIGLIILLVHLVRLESFGIPYLAPIVNPNIEDFKDMYIRLPLQFLRKRPEYMNTGDKIRQKGGE